MRSLLPSVLLPLVVAVATACASAGGGSGERGDLITLTDLDRASGRSAYDVVQASRPLWLRVRGQQSLRVADETGVSDDPLTPQSDQIVVYLDNARLGGVETLRQIPAESVGTIGFVNAATATNRWGTGHPNGAILVTSRSRPR